MLVSVVQPVGSEMLVGVVQPLGSRRYAAAGPPPSSNSNLQSTGNLQSAGTLQGSGNLQPRSAQQARCVHRPNSPTLARTQPAPVVRQRRATVATASPEAQAAWAESAAETGLGHSTGVRRLSRPPLEVQRVAPRPDPEAEFLSRMPSPLPSLWRDKYELCEECPALGGGAFAEVFKVQHRVTLECFAVKVMHRPNFALRGIERQIESEIAAMRMAADAARSGHSEGHIVQLLDVAEECEYVYLLLELCEQGDLLRKLNAEPLQRFREDVGAMWARQLLLGLKTLHRLGFLHRDIKPDNLLCTAGGVLKIADFGWCSLSDEAPTCLAGTFQYMAPEVLQNRPQTEAVDVWSAGVALHQMLVGKPLLATYLGPGATQLTECDPHRATAVKQRRLVAEITSTCPPSYDRRPPHLSSLCWDFLRQLLIPEAEHRITVDGALRHPWLSKAAGSSNPEYTPVAAPELASNVELEETGPCTARERDHILEVPASPPCSKIKENLSPSTEKSPNSIDNVPTPLKPRSWDPNRNIAYTPPVEDGQENTTPEVSPERKKVNELCELAQPVRTPLSRLSPPAPPPRALGRRLGGSVIISRPPRGNGPFESPVTEGKGVLLSGSASALLRQPKFDHDATNVLLRKLHSCNEQLRQIHCAMLSSERRLQGLDSGNELDFPEQPVDTLGSTYRGLDSTYRGLDSTCRGLDSTCRGLDSTYRGLDSTVRGLDTTCRGLDSTCRVLHEVDPSNNGYLNTGFDALTATAPPLIGTCTPGLIVPNRNVLDKSARGPTEGLQSARGRENIPVQNPIAIGSAKAANLRTPVVRSGVVCHTTGPRYAPVASPTKPSNNNAGQPPPSASRISPSGQAQQQGQRYLLTVPTPGVPQMSTQAAMWAGASPLHTSGVLPRRGRVSVAGQMGANM